MSSYNSSPSSYSSSNITRTIPKEIPFHVYHPAAKTNQQDSEDNKKEDRPTTSMLHVHKPPRDFFSWIFEEPAGLIIISTLLSFFIQQAALGLQKTIVRPCLVKSFFFFSHKKKRDKHSEQQENIPIQSSSSCPNIPSSFSPSVHSHSHSHSKSSYDDIEGQIGAELFVIVAELLIGLITVYILYRFLMRSIRKYNERRNRKNQTKTITNKRRKKWGQDVFENEESSAFRDKEILPEDEDSLNLYQTAVLAANETNNAENILLDSRSNNFR